jgi:DNA-binding NarL/FixJ family response regulator
MTKTRVLLANRPRLMRDLVRATISDHADIEVLGEIDDESKIPEVVAELKPDFVIVALDRPDERPAICDYLLAHHPLIKVLAVALEHDNSVFFWSDIHSLAIESSEEGLLNALRGKPTGRHQQIM